MKSGVARPFGLHATIKNPNVIRLAVFLKYVPKEVQEAKKKSRWRDLVKRDLKAVGIHEKG